MSDIIFHTEYKRDWMRAFPLGNGRIGAMFYGDPHKETIEINEESLWSGKQLEESYLSDSQNLARIRNLLFEEKYEEASRLCTDTLLASPPRVRSYESMGEIIIDFTDKSPWTDYRKELNLDEAIATVSYKKNNISYYSESFISEKYDCFIYKHRSPEGYFSCHVSMERGQDALTSAPASDTVLLDGQIICPAHEYYGDEFAGMMFGAQLYIVSDGKMSNSEKGVAITDATEMTIYASFSTTYDIEKFDFDNDINYKQRNKDIISEAIKVNYNIIRDLHIQQHKELYNKVCFSLGKDLLEDIPTDQRLRRVMKEDASDPGLYCLYYNFGRYLLIESSGKNAKLPANLQGIWCNGYRPPWGSDYHTNINLQMNYWCADNTNISESFMPFSDYVRNLSIFGAETAKRLFGASGWVCNHTSDIFGRTGVHDSVECGFFPMAGPWLCLNLWDHYEYTDDIEYLKEIFPILTGSCRFLLDFLVEKDGFLLTAPSNSPENTFFYEEDGQRKASMFTYGATIDFQIISSLFEKTAFACEVLNKEPALAASMEQALQKLPPLRISRRYGTLCEWIKDYEEAEPGHRHISHLFGLYPGDLINESDPEIFNAARKTIERRLAHGGAATGWSRAWTINFFARLKDGVAAEEHLIQLLKQSTADNLFDMHPPFQIDGNFGAVAGITEMLIQSHKGKSGHRIIELLPALPPNWSEGFVKGLRARGAFVFDIYWKDSKIYKVCIKSEKENILRMEAPAGRIISDKTYTLSQEILQIQCLRGEIIELNFVN